MADARIEELKSLLPQCLLHDWVRLGSRLTRLLRDAHHPDRHDAVLNRLLQQARASAALREERRLSVPAIAYPPKLPITARKDDIVAAIRTRQVVVIAGETGSGKTTQIPKMCLEAGLGIEARIGCTQPRRVAALSISRRIAEELDVPWGHEVGCKIRFDDRSSGRTYIKLMTDGILLAETQGDPNLSEYNAIILDEAHERSLNIDFLLGYLKGLLARRHDLKLIITSATIDTQAFSRHFDDAPIIEVSGRVYPVEVQYQPLDADSEERGDISYVDAAVQATERVLSETASGDVLVFMPGERDIRETSDQLDGRLGGRAEIIPLFARLSSGDQQRVFALSARRKIVVATNIAETSLTIPGIRCVIDAGLARISRYNAHTRTRRLPVEPVSQSSANQRKGRAGRVEAGVCIRLYSEEDYQSRPLFTQPEILRANLAEVILRMKAFHLGAIETFPFVQAPTPAAIAGGYRLLQELGALDAQRELTPLGEDLARLPIDPTLGRMLLQSQHEHATRELLIIAAGLSIQDPRERPLDQKDAAAAVHQRFANPQSDFLSLLHIWNAVHDQWETLRTQNQRRKFCRQQFLSYIRMREWQDLHAQLHDALEDLGTLKLNESSAAYEAIHRSILAGLIGHVARFEDRNQYRTGGNRLVSVFPGSALFTRAEPPNPRAPKNGGKPPPKPKSSQPEWIVAGEIIETSQLFARTVAGIDPQWICELAPHCCKVAHQNPHWSPEAGRVLAEELVTLNGLEVRRRLAAYGNINPGEATAIFIRSALVEENLSGDRHPACRKAAISSPAETNDSSRGQDARPLRQPECPPPQYPFLAHNRSVRAKIENWRTRSRRHDLHDLDDALCAFYARHIANVSSLDELNRLLRGQPPDFLCITEAELAGGQSLEYDPRAFPDAIPVAGQPVPLAYAYAPGEEHDGVTIQLPFSLAQSAQASLLEWAVPGLRAGMIGELLRALPKSIRRKLMPFPPKVAEIVRDFQPSGPSFLQELAQFIYRRYGMEIPVSSWPGDALPAHLRPRIEIVDHNCKSLGAGRDLHQLREQLEKAQVEAVAEAELSAWSRAAQQWERFGLTHWTMGDLPERITVIEGVTSVAAGEASVLASRFGLPLYAWPGLQVEDGVVSLRLFRTPDAARMAGIAGLQRLVELVIQRDLGWLEKDLHSLKRFEALYAPLGSADELRETALNHLRRHILPADPLPALARAHFERAVDEARRRLPGLLQQLSDRLGAILPLYQQARQRLGAAKPLGAGVRSPAKESVSSPAGGAKASRKPQSLSGFSQIAIPAAANPLADELAALMPPRFLERIPFDRLAHLPRYLKALLVRAERAGLNPVKNRERVRQLAPYEDALRKLLAEPVRTPEARRELETFQWMIEEFKVSLFAQELGTAMPVSARRLDQLIERMQRP